MIHEIEMGIDEIEDMRRTMDSEKLVGLMNLVALVELVTTILEWWVRKLDCAIRWDTWNEYYEVQ